MPATLFCRHASESFGGWVGPKEDINEELIPFTWDRYLLVFYLHLEFVVVQTFPERSAPAGGRERSQWRVWDCQGACVGAHLQLKGLQRDGQLFAKGRGGTIMLEEKVDMTHL